MSLLLGAFDTIDTAWIEALSEVNRCRDGRGVNLALVVRRPAVAGYPAVGSAIDTELTKHHRQAVSSVASTIFPARLYRAPAFAWSTDLPPERVRELDAAASRVYEQYLTMLPTLMTLPANDGGTYFSRMITWPGTPGGLNQLEQRIHYLRLAQVHGNQAHSASDIAIESPTGQDYELPGISIYAASDLRQEGFPCLSHISLTALDGVLSMNATYRHWHLITRGYGNLVGLSRLLTFLAQQSGFEVGELMVTATKANAERNPYRKRGVTELLATVSTAIDHDTDES